MSGRCQLEVYLDTAKISSIVRDTGIGTLRSIVEKLYLPDEPATMFELIKGKTATMPETHSSEGVFFVSRLADRFVLESRREYVKSSIQQMPGEPIDGSAVRIQDVGLFSDAVWFPGIDHQLRLNA